MVIQKNPIDNLKKSVAKEKKIIKELTSLFKDKSKKSSSEKKMISSQITSLKDSLKKINIEVYQTINKMYLAKPLVPKTQPAIKPITLPKLQKVVGVASPVKTQGIPTQVSTTKTAQKAKEAPVKPKRRKRINIKLTGELKPIGLEKETLKRLKKQEKKVIEVKKVKPKKYLKLANKAFSKTAINMLEKPLFQRLERDLVKANLQFTPTTYISLILFTTLLSVFGGFVIFLFFLFFNFGAEVPFITRVTESLGIRVFKVVWILIVVPVLTFFIMYIYPSLERKSTAVRIDYELPFATLNMSAISGSLIDPSKIFSIILSTKEYPYLSKEFRKIMNEINVHGYNFVNALREAAFNSPSKKLSELFSGLATTINSGGDLPNFFEERSKSLLFEHRLEREKNTKTAETFMDIYISVVIAAPMILMLLLMMMKISGL